MNQSLIFYFNIMTETKMGETKKSDAPMILGIFGFISAIPGLMCTGCLAGCTSLLGIADGTKDGAAVAGIFSVFYLLLFLIPAVVGFIFSFKTKKSAKQAGTVLIVCSIILLFSSLGSFNWFFGLISVSCYLIAGILSIKLNSKS